MSIHCPVSLGELIDKITILEIKKMKITDPKKLHFIEVELSEITKTFSSLILSPKEKLLELKNKLKDINQELWDIEDRIRVKEEKKEFDQEFISIARSVYMKNDLRFVYKNEINQSFQSGIREVKSYQKY